MNPFRVFHYDKSDLVISQLKNFVINQTDILTKEYNTKEPVYKTDMEQNDIIDHVPELFKLLDLHQYVPYRFIFLYINQKVNNKIHAHIDSNPRLLLPVINCEGSVTKFFNIPEKYFFIELNGKILVRNLWTGNTEPYLIDKFELTQPMLVNGRIPHAVTINPNNTNPRVSFSVKFKNDIVL